MLQISAFADYQPGGGGGQEAAAADDNSGNDAPAESGGGEEEEAVEGGGGGGGGDFPAHMVLAMPALSPTMSAGAYLDVNTMFTAEP